MSTTTGPSSSAAITISMAILFATLASTLTPTGTAAANEIAPPTPLAAGAAAAVTPLGPPWFAGNLVYYNSFDRVDVEPEILAAGLSATEKGPAEAVAGAVRGGRHIHALEIHGSAVSPCRPLTISFWWALPKDLAIEGGFSLFSWTGGGYIGAFCHGKGEWCALRKPAGVLQVYYFPGIQNVNAIYDMDLCAHLDLHAGAWHHTAAVFRQALSVELYTDGKKVCEIPLSGRPLSEKDNLNTLTIGATGGDGLLVDEVALLDRAVDGEMIADYYRGVSQIREYQK